MRTTAPKFLIVSTLLACGEDPVCIIPPCPFPVAMLVSVHTGVSQGGIPGAFVRVSGPDEVACAGGSADPCFVSGYAGTYQLDVGAPGFQTVHRTVEVTGKSAVRCLNCPTVNTQQVDIVLVPTA